MKIVKKSLGHLLNLVPAKIRITAESLRLRKDLPQIIAVPVPAHNPD